MSTYIYNEGIVFNTGVNLQGYISQLSNNSGYLYGNTYNEVNRNSYGVGWLNGAAGNCGNINFGNCYPKIYLVNCAGWTMYYYYVNCYNCNCNCNC